MAMSTPSGTRVSKGGTSGGSGQAIKQRERAAGPEDARTAPRGSAAGRQRVAPAEQSVGEGEPDVLGANRASVEGEQSEQGVPRSATGPNG